MSTERHIHFNGKVTRPALQTVQYKTQCYEVTCSAKLTASETKSVQITVSITSRKNEKMLKEN